jgi:hypothetical protein
MVYDGADGHCVCPFFIAKNQGKRLKFFAPIVGKLFKYFKFEQFNNHKIV